jgi:hypothetical protein
MINATHLLTAADPLDGQGRGAGWIGAATTAAFAAAVKSGRLNLPLPGSGRTRERWVHGANLGIRASAYLATGGFRSLRTAEDHALLAAVTEACCPVLQASDITVQTSARRLARAPAGFSHLLRILAGQQGVSRPPTGSEGSPLRR